MTALDSNCVWNNRQLDCLLNNVFGIRAKRISKLRITDHVMGTHRWLAYSPHEGPAMRKTFPYQDVIMIINFCSWNPLGWKSRKKSLTLKAWASGYLNALGKGWWCWGCCAGPDNAGQIKSISSWLLIPWPLAAPDHHHQPCYCSCVV